MAAAVLKVLGIWLEDHMRGSGEDHARLAVQSAVCDLVAPETLNSSAWLSGQNGMLETHGLASPRELGAEGVTLSLSEEGSALGCVSALGLANSRTRYLNFSTCSTHRVAMVARSGLLVQGLG